MEIDLKKITVEELAKDYNDNADEGVTGYAGKLDIRPAFQREFVYDDKKRNAVINTVQKNFPLNVMYWSVGGDTCDYEIIDGQQRTISLCQYVHGDFSIDGMYFHSLPEDKQKQINEYELTIYLCSGTHSEKLDWFEIINIAGMVLEHQELLNAIHSGPWVSDAKRYFSKGDRPKIGDKYLKGSPIRQAYLETAIDWISGGEIKEYMSKNQHEPNANKLWLHFLKVINWVEATFPKYRREMKGIKWGTLYSDYANTNLDPTVLENKITKLMQDDDVQKKSGIYYYILTGKEKYLNIRSFTESQKRQVYEKQNGICPGWKQKCGKHFEIEEMEADHIVPWSNDGKTTTDNCQMLCKEDNRRKSGI